MQEPGRDAGSSNGRSPVELQSTRSRIVGAVVSEGTRELYGSPAVYA